MPFAFDWHLELDSKGANAGRWYLLRSDPFAAIIAVAPMDTYDAIAFRAAPPLLFFCNEGAQANIPDAFEVLYHAHCVFRSVSFIQLL